MKSTITKVYDYKQAEIPAELKLWRIKDEEIAAKLETLSRNHAFETDAETVETFDSVACRGESASARWNRPVLLFYPGRGLCDAVIENALVGKKVGESCTVSSPDGDVTLTVTRIIRRRNIPVGDDLVKTEGIEGVETVADYYRWYREQNEPERRSTAGLRIAYQLLRQITENSEFLFDEEEKRVWVTNHVESFYQILIRAGIDPTIPKEGVDFLTEEQAKAKLYAEQEHLFDGYVANGILVQTLAGVEDLDAFCQTELKRLAEDNNITVDALIDEAGWAAYYDRVLQNKALELLVSYTEQFLED